VRSSFQYNWDGINRYAAFPHDAGRLLHVYAKINIAAVFQVLFML